MVVIRKVRFEMVAYNQISQQDSSKKKKKLKS